MIEYRSYRNDDPPKLLRLWNQVGMGRGAASGVPIEVFDQLVFAQPYFEHDGLQLACDGDEVVGMAHAGFGCQADQGGLCHDTGVICQVLVLADYRRRGIGRELLRLAESYLRRHGARRITAGIVPSADPFYCGLYGGAQAAGFLESDPAAGAFFEAAGYESAETYGIYQMPLLDRKPFDQRLLEIRRRTRIDVRTRHDSASWWWNTRVGRLDFVRFELCYRDRDEPVASLTLVGLDQFAIAWKTRAVGLVDVTVVESERRQGLGQALVLETCRQLKQESLSLVETHAADDNPAGRALLESCGFERVDTGVAYRQRAGGIAASRA